MCRIICFTMIVTFITSTADANKNRQLHAWYEKITDQKFNCPAPEESELNPGNGQPILKVVDCDDPSATYRYDYKLSGGKKPKKGPFNGYAKILVAQPGNNEKYNYGFRNKKCIQVYSDMVSQISGKFVNDVIEGDVVIHFIDKTFMKGYSNKGYIVGTQRYFDDKGILTNATDTATRYTYLRRYDLNENSVVSLFGCQHTKEGTRCIVMNNSTFEDLNSCLQITEDFYVKCYPMSELSNVDPDNCKLKLQISVSDTGENLFNMRLSKEEIIVGKNAKSSFDCSNSLDSWLTYVQNPDLFWYHYYDEIDSPLNLKNPDIEIEIGFLKNRAGWSHRHIYIESQVGDGILFGGDLYNGKLIGNVDPKLANHPAWRTRLLIGISESGIRPRDLDDSEQKMKKYDQYILGSLKNGKLHGLVQIYGKLTADPEGHCSSKLFKGLSFVGWFEEGKPVGPYWRALLGGTYLYGVVDENGEFTGPDIAFIYQDLELALVGEFQKGLMVNGQEAEVIGSTCNEHGIRIPTFSKPHGPVYHYEEATNTTFGDQPHLRDPLDKKYVYLKDSNSFISAGEGAYATRDIPKDIYYVIYGGRLFNKEETDILSEELKKKAEANRWMKDNPAAEAEWMYRHQLEDCGLKIDIPLEYGPTEKYQGTLGHKMNHRFDPDTKYRPIETARFGITLGVKTMAPIQKDQEFFAHYAYTMDFAPKWYRELYKQFAKDNPTKVDKGQMQIIEYIDEKLAKVDIPLWGDREALAELFKEFRESKSPQNDE